MDTSFEWKKITVGIFEANCYILKERETREGIVIDPGDEPELILKEVEDFGIRTVKYIVNTHGHIDHISANKRLIEETGARLLIHRLDSKLLLNPIRNFSLFMLKLPKPVHPDKLLEEGDKIRVGEGSLKVIHTPGHTEGSICLVGEGLLITGDTLFYESVGRTDLMGGSYRDLLRSLKAKILPLSPDLLVLPGHGPSAMLSEIKKINPFLQMVG